jgi:hypothetical protein
MYLSSLPLSLSQKPISPSPMQTLLQIQAREEGNASPQAFRTSLLHYLGLNTTLYEWNLALIRYPINSQQRVDLTIHLHVHRRQEPPVSAHGQKNNLGSFVLGIYWAPQIYEKLHISLRETRVFHKPYCKNHIFAQIHWTNNTTSQISQTILQKSKNET